MDLQAHRVTDVLPDRDRAGNYADGARRGAPKAIQVGDRFHLLLNLTTALQRLFERKQDGLHRLAAQEKVARIPEASREPAAVADPLPSGASPLTATEAQRQGRRTRRKHRYEEVIKLHQQGASHVAIARLVGLHRETVRRYINAASFPEIARPSKRSKLDPYKAYLRGRWAQGAYNVKQLLAELRELGYRQGKTIVYDYLRSLRERPEGQEAETSTKKKQAPSLSPSDLSARQAAWLFACNPRKLRLAQVFKLDHMRRSEEELEIAYQLAQDFRVMVTSSIFALFGRPLSGGEEVV